MVILLKKVVQRVLIFLCLFSIILPIAVPVFAEDEQGQDNVNASQADAINEKTSSFIEFFSSERGLYDATELSGKEIQVFGVFLSNFFVPYTTNMNGTIDIAKVVDKLATIFNKGSEDDKKSLESVIQQVLKTASETQTDLYMDTASESKAPANLRKLMIAYEKEDNFSLYYFDSIGSKQLIDTVVNGVSRAHVDLALSVAMGVNLEEAGKLFSSDMDDNANEMYLKVDSFGNITLNGGNAISSGLLVLPACMNPRTFTKSSSGGDPSTFVFPMNNAFYMGSFMKPETLLGGYTDKNGNFIDEDVVPKISSVFSSLNSNEKPMLGVFGLQYWDGIETWSNIMGLADGTAQSSGLKTKVAISINESKWAKAFKKATKYHWWEISARKSSIKNMSTVSCLLDIDKVFAGMGLFDNQQEDISEIWGDAARRDSIKVHNMFYDSIGDKSNLSSDLEIAGQKNVYGLLNSRFLQSLREVNSSIDISDLMPLVDAVNAGKDLKDVEEAEDSVSSFASRFHDASANIKKLKLSDCTVGKDPSRDDIVAMKVLSDLYDAVGKDRDKFNNICSDRFKTERGTSSLLDSVPQLATVYAFIAGYGNLGDSLPLDYVYNLTGVNEAVYYFLKNSTTIDGGIVNVGMNNNWAGIYWAYVDCICGINFDSEGNISIGDVDTLLPTIGDTITDGTIAAPNSYGATSDSDEDYKAMLKQVVKNAKDLLSLDNNEYKSNWLIRTINSMLLSIHNAIVGFDSGSDNAMLVAPKNYSGVTSAVTIPRMSELPYTAMLVDNFDIIYVSMLVLILIILVIMTLLGHKTVRQSLLTACILAFVLMIPNTLVDTAIVQSNKVAESLFSDKFNFWAISQHQQMLSNDMQSANNKGATTLYYENFTMAENQNRKGNKSSGVTLKWMSPKKISMFDSIYGGLSAESKLSTNMSLFKWLMSGFLYEENYSGDPLATYLYRPYYDLVRIAKSNYIEPTGDRSAVDLSGCVMPQFDKTHEQILDNIRKGYYKNNHSNLLQVDGTGDDCSYVDAPAYVGPLLMTTSHFAPMIESAPNVAEAIMREDLINPYTEGNVTNIGLDLSSVETNSRDGTAQFLQYSESVFYYFYNVLKSSYYEQDTAGGTVAGDPVASTSEGFNNLLLSPDFFKYVDRKENLSYIRDFLDMESLFTYVIPYLERGNQYVGEFISAYGSDVPRDYATQGVYDETDPEISRKVLEASNKRKAMQRVWALYSPWVEHLNTYQNANQVVRVAGKKARVLNALYPNSYPASTDNVSIDRPMVFSEADMIAKGIDYSDLTAVELKLLKVEEKTRKDMLYLINYMGYDEETLLSAAAMMATFNFNREFSSYSMHGNVLLYPQGFELKNFNYDAFLRMIYLNSTGTPITDSASIYETIMNKTSPVTGIFMILNDVEAVYVIPALKVIVLFMLFFLGLLITLFCVVSEEGVLWRMVLKGAVLPVVLLCLGCSTYSLIISVFVGDGVSDLVGSRGISIATNDPTITTLLLLLANTLLIYVLYKILRLVAGQIKLFGSFSLASIGGMALDVGKSGLSSAMRGFDSVTGRVTHGLGRLINLDFSLGGLLRYRRRVVRDRTHKRMLKEQLREHSALHDLNNYMDDMTDSVKNTKESLHDMGRNSGNQRKTNSGISDSISHKIHEGESKLN